MSKRKKKPVYRISDLQEMVNQLGGRLHIELMPRELPSLLDPRQPPMTDKPVKPRRKASR